MASPFFIYNIVYPKIEENATKIFLKKYKNKKYFLKFLIITK